MISIRYASGKALAPCFIAAAFLVVPSIVVAKSSTVYSFLGKADGESPYAPLTQDAAGNLYGTTRAGGSGTDCFFGKKGCGTIFRIAPDGTESVLYNFAGGCDGAIPMAGLVSDGAGNFYGTTQGGGNCDSGGEGTVFKLAADGTESVLYAFHYNSDGDGGDEPLGGLLLDGQGNLYGTTEDGGNFGGHCHSEGCGVVFEITTNGTEKILHAFTGKDGQYPSGDLVSDAQGNLYGVTPEGGGAENGTVFKIAPDGTETVLHVFNGGKDGSYPSGNLVLDGNGDLYGTTAGGGTADYGIVFRLTPGGKKTTLYSFRGGLDGRTPYAGLVMDKLGNLYGTTYAGGSTGCEEDKSGCGTAFKLATGGKESILLALFGNKGTHPYAQLILGQNGALYGTASSGGLHKKGVVFKAKE